MSSSNLGIFEYDPRFLNLGDYECIYRNLDNEECLYHISNEHSTSCSWAFSTIINNSYYEKPNIYPFKYVKDINDQYVLKAGRRVKVAKLFSDLNLKECVVCFNNEKIYCIYNNKIEGYRFIQRHIDEEDEDSFVKLDTIDISLKGTISASEVTEFGIVIETKDFLYVLQSNGFLNKINNRPGEVVRWRVFSRSNCYANQLHVIYKDKLEIISFNADAFEKS